MTGFSFTQPRAATLPKNAALPEYIGRHGNVVRAKLTLRRMFYIARHAMR